MPLEVRAAVGYYAEYRDEVDEQIDRNVAEADAAEQQWRREQNALACSSSSTGCSPP